MWLIDLPKKAIKSLFTSRVTVQQPPQSELSSPLVNFKKRNIGRLRFSEQHKVVLSELSRLGKATANQIARTSSLSSADKRLNELYHLGLADIEKTMVHGVGVRFHYSVSDEGRKII